MLRTKHLAAATGSSASQQPVLRSRQVRQLQSQHAKRLLAFKRTARAAHNVLRGARRCHVVTHAAASAAQFQPPTPAPKFTRQDLRRIKQNGPQLKDLFHTHSFPRYDENGIEVRESYTWVPPTVMGFKGVTDVAEPQWKGIPQMELFPFLRGLRERNWQSPLFNEAAEPWKLQIFQDAGRFMRPSFAGYRALVTKPDNSQFWVDIPIAGADNWLRDNAAGGTAGGIWRYPRTTTPARHPSEFGYNQVFQEIFGAYEQRVPLKVHAKVWEKGYADMTKVEYDCPGERLLQISYHTSKPEFSLWSLYTQIPTFLLYAGAMLFLVVMLAIGIFRPRKQMPSDIIQAQEFAQSKAKARKDGATSVSFEDVAGLNSIRADVQEIVEFLQQPKKFAELRAKPPKGVLLEGPPGTGKTLIAKAIAGEAGVPFYQMSGSEFVEAIVGVGAARVRDLFKRARVQYGPCIIFVDEIDALGIQRASAGVKTNEEREQTLNQLLTEMDGFSQDSGVVFIAATNRADLLDKALTRAGRFDRKITVRKPDTQARFEILKVHAKKYGGLREGQRDELLMQLAKDTPNLVGADLANILNEAALEVVRRGGEQVEERDVYSALDRILQGVPRPRLSDPLPGGYNIRRLLAVHEVGRAVAATILRQRHGRLESINRVSVQPRGRDWTRTMFTRGKDEDYMVTTKGRMLDRLRVILAGRVAEEVMGGEKMVTTYSIGQLSKAFQLAEKIVAHYGLTSAGIMTYARAYPRSRRTGTDFEVHVEDIDQDAFGRTIPGNMPSPSNITIRTTRQEAHKLLREAYDDLEAIMTEHRDVVMRAVDIILEKDDGQLTGKDIEDMLQQHASSPSRDQTVLVA